MKALPGGRGARDAAADELIGSPAGEMSAAGRPKRKRGASFAAEAPDEPPLGSPATVGRTPPSGVGGPRIVGKRVDEDGDVEYCIVESDDGVDIVCVDANTDIGAFKIGVNSSLQYPGAADSKGGAAIEQAKVAEAPIGGSVVTRAADVPAVQEGAAMEVDKAEALPCSGAPGGIREEPSQPDGPPAGTDLDLQRPLSSVVDGNVGAAVAAAASGVILAPHAHWSQLSAGPRASEWVPEREAPLALVIEYELRVRRARHEAEARARERAAAAKREEARRAELQAKEEKRAARAAARRLSLQVLHAQRARLQQERDEKRAREARAKQERTQARESARESARAEKARRRAERREAPPAYKCGTCAAQYSAWDGAVCCYCAGTYHRSCMLRAHPGRVAPNDSST
eukprot:jgi/Mesen1/4193/ME000219S03320